MQKMIILILIVVVAVMIMDSEGVYSMSQFTDLIKGFWNSLTTLFETETSTT